MLTKDDDFFSFSKVVCSLENAIPEKKNRLRLTY